MFNWLKNLRKKKTPPKVSTETMLIWDVIEGPIDIDDLPDEMPEGHNFLNVCKVEVDGEIVHANLWFETFDEAYEMVKHFHKSIEPIEMGYGR